MCQFLYEIVDSAAIDTNAKIPPEVLQQIKDLGLFGQQIPEEYGDYPFPSALIILFCKNRL